MHDILRLSESNPMFYEYCPPFVTRESILNDMKALPQGKTDAEKYYIGFFEGQKLIAIRIWCLHFQMMKQFILDCLW